MVLYDVMFIPLAAHFEIRVISRHKVRRKITANLSLRHSFSNNIIFVDLNGVDPGVTIGLPCKTDGFICCMRKDQRFPF